MAHNGGRAGHAYQQLRRIVIHRDGIRCHLCGRTCKTTGDPKSGEYLTVDHITPLSHAATPGERQKLLLDPANARPACRSCNSRRGATQGATNALEGW